MLRHLGMYVTAALLSGCIADAGVRRAQRYEPKDRERALANLIEAPLPNLFRTHPLIKTYVATRLREAVEKARRGDIKVGVGHIRGMREVLRKLDVGLTAEERALVLELCDVVEASALSRETKLHAYVILRSNFRWLEHDAMESALAPHRERYLEQAEAFEHAPWTRTAYRMLAQGFGGEKVTPPNDPPSEEPEVGAWLWEALDADDETTRQAAAARLTAHFGYEFRVYPKTIGVVLVSDEEFPFLELPEADPTEELAHFSARDTGARGGIDGVFVATARGATIGLETWFPTLDTPRSVLSVAGRIGGDAAAAYSGIELEGMLHSSSQGGGVVASAYLQTRPVGMSFGLGYELSDDADFRYRALFIDLRWISVFNTYLAIDWRARPNLLALVNAIRRRGDADPPRVNYSPVSAALRTGIGPVSVHFGGQMLLGSSLGVMPFAGLDINLGKAAFD